MKQVRFKPLPGLALDGSPVVFTHAGFDIRTLLEMLSVPLHLKKLSFAESTAMWTEEMSFRWQQEDGGALVAQMGGFVNWLASQGYRCVPLETEFELYEE